MNISAPNHYNNGNNLEITIPSDHKMKNNKIINQQYFCLKIILQCFFASQVNVSCLCLEICVGKTKKSEEGFLVLFFKCMHGIYEMKSFRCYLTAF